MGLAAFMYAFGMAIEDDMVDGLRRGSGLDIAQMGDGKDGQNGERSESRGRGSCGGRMFVFESVEGRWEKAESIIRQ